MSNFTYTFDAIIQGQQYKELTANAYFDATSPASIFGRRQSTCSGLTWGYYGGTIVVDGVLTQIANGVISLTASATNYVEASRSGVVSKNTTGFTPGATPLYEVTVGSATVTNHLDYRAWVQPDQITNKASVTVTTADVTLSAVQARCRYLTISGSLTNNRSVIVPNDWEGVVFCNNTGAFTTTIKTLAGTGKVVGQAKRAVLFADGTNVERITADV